jgi:hypothetical protein
MTTTCSSVAIVKHDFFFFMSETSTKDAIYTSTIQSVLEYEIVLGLMAYTTTLITRSRGRGTSKSGDRQVHLHTRGPKT